uniref:Putative site-specific tyrosine recombinase n=1 Tax=viral metagenome TaxID=1070528 RepID=A0A6H1ZQE1_9ZZZZ
MKFVDPIRNIDDIDKVQAYLYEKSQRDYLLFVFGINTALRISDIITLKVKDVVNQKHIVVYEKKTGKRQMIYLNDKVKNIIEDYVSFHKLKPNSYLFYSQNDGRTHIKRIQAWRIISEATIICKIDGNYGTHTLRKTFCYQAYLKTKDIASIMRLLNHTNLESTFRYLGINQDTFDDLHKTVVL